MQTDLALPDLPIEAIRLYPDSDRAIDTQRMQTERCDSQLSTEWSPLHACKTQMLFTLPQ